MLKSNLKGLSKWLLGPCLSALLWIVALALALLVAIQAVWLYGVYTKKPVPLPAPALQWVERKASDNLPGAEVRFDGLAIAAHGLVRTQGLRLYLDGHAQPVATMDAADINFSLAHLAMGRLHPESIRIRDGRLYCPIMFSPTGRRELVAHSLSGDLRLRQRQVRLEHFHGMAVDIPLTANGAWDTPLAVMTGSPAQAGEPLMIAVAGLGRLIVLRQHTDWLRNADLHLRFFQTPGSFPEVTVEAKAESMHLEGTLEWEHMLARASLSWNGQWQLPEPLTLHFRQLKKPGYGSAKDLELALHLPPETGLDASALYRATLEFNGARLQTPWGGVHTLNGQLRAGGPGELRFRTLADLDGSPLSAAGHLNFLFRSGQATIRTRGLNVRERVEGLAHLPLPEALTERLEWPNSLTTRADIEIASGWQPSALQFHGEIKNLAFNEQPIHHLALRGGARLDQQRAFIDDFHAVFPSGEIEGDATYNLDNTLITASVRSDGMHPADLNALFPDWWTELIDDFEFHGRLPAANFHIHKVMNLRFTMFYFGSVEVWDASYRGLDFDHGTTLVAGRPSFVEIYDLDTSRQGRDTRGSLNWVFDPEISGMKSMNWSILTEVPPSAGKVIFEENIRTIFEDFELSGDSEATSVGKIYNENRVPELKIHDRVLISGRTPDPLTYRGYPLEHLDFDADYRPGVLRAEIRSAGVAGGEAEGFFQSRFENENTHLEFDVRLQQARRQGLTDLARRFGERNQPPEDMAPEKEGETLAIPPPATPEDRSRIDLQLAASGPMENPFAFEGTGFFELRDPDLARIRLFGLLSNILDQTPLPLGTLALNRMGSEFFLDGPVIRFPEMRVTGPVTRIKARGEYSMVMQDMNFSAQVFLGNPDESAFLSMITSIFRPLTYALELNLTGPLQSPSWSFAYGPGAIFGASRPPREREPIPELERERADERAPPPSLDVEVPRGDDPETFPPLP